MRVLLLAVCTILICGCVSRTLEEPAAVEIKPKVYFEDNFSGGLGGWRVVSSGGGSVEVVDRPDFKVKRALEVRSQMVKSAYAAAPNFTMDWGRDYVVLFDFMLQHRDNFGYTVYRDRYVDLVLGEATGVYCVEDGRRTFIGRVDVNKWAAVWVKVEPGFGEYEVYLDRELKRSCTVNKGDVGTFLVGDTDPSDYIHGDGFWDNFRVADRF